VRLKRDVNDNGVTEKVNTDPKSSEARLDTAPIESIAKSEESAVVAPKEDETEIEQNMVS